MDKMKASFRSDFWNRNYIHTLPFHFQEDDCIRVGVGNKCQRQPENVDFRRDEMSFFAGQHEVVMQP